MSWLFSLLLSVHILLAFAIIWLVLMQHGKGADMGAAFGSGASGSLFGASGSANFLSRSTALLATLFFLTSMGLAYIASNAPKKTDSVMQDAVQSAPVSPTVTDTAPEALPGGLPEGDTAPGAADSKAREIPR